MATLKQAKLYVKQAQADRDIFVNNVLYQAALTYFDWLKAFNEYQVYNEFLANAQLRFDGIKQSVEVGERAAIDSVEARIVLNNRKLNLEKSRVTLLKRQLEVANFLWLENFIPLELQDNVIPEVNSMLNAESVLGTVSLTDEAFQVENHPKVQSLNFKYDGLTVDKRLKTNKLLPRIDLQYNFLSESYNTARSFNTANYKSGLSVRFPLFLRKERGDLRLAKIKLQDTKFEIDATKLNLQNKVRGVQAELSSYELQLELLQTVVDDYVVLLAAEERKFNLGESSIFLVNSRETKLIEAKLKLVELNNTIANTKAKYFNILAINPIL